MSNKYYPQKCPNCKSSKFKEVIEVDIVKIKCQRCGFINIKKIKK